MADPRDTIFALSTGRLPSGVAVVRVSGPDALPALEAIAGRTGASGALKYAVFKNRVGEVLDRGLCVCFKAPFSFTGEDCVEFHVHGGAAVVAALLKDLSDRPGLRHAEPGEFTRRAFLHGKVDLVQAESLADLLGAETEAQRKFAIETLSGAQSTQYLSWRDRLLRVRGRIEAKLDFSDESDVGGIDVISIGSDLARIVDDFDQHIKGFRASEIIRDGLDVVILGAPNVGKSTLMNALARRDVSIVHDEPGTTRDLVEVSMDVDGFKIRVTDTAGVRDPSSPVETIGIERALLRAGNCDLILAVSDAAAPTVIEVPERIPVVFVANKIDQANGTGEIAGLPVSARTGAGLDALISEIAKRAAALSGAATAQLPLRLRHVEHLRRGADHLRAAIEHPRELEIAAEYCRLAEREIGRITGEVDAEALLGYIFSQFCIGK